jgi:hypothetical protein
VSWFPGSFQGAECGGHVLWELGAGGGVNGCGGRKAFEVPESVEGLNEFLGVADDGDEVGLGNWYRELGQVFQLAVKEEGGIGEFFPRQAEGGAGRRSRQACAPIRAIQAHAFLEVAVGRVANHLSGLGHAN